MNIPYRYDQGTVLPEGSINNMIHKCNKKLNEILQTFQHVKILESTYERTWYMKLGYHLNNRGKDMVPNQICKIIGHSVLSFIKPETPLPLQDTNFQFEEKKSDSVVNVCPQSTKVQLEEKSGESAVNVAGDVAVDSIIERNDCTDKQVFTIRSSMRTKKTPLSRNIDFLW